MPALTFDGSDIDELVRRFTLAELKAEVYQTEVELSTSRAFADGKEGFLQAYLSTARLALDVARWLDSKAKPYRGKGNLLDAEDVKRGVDLVSLVEQHTKLRKSGHNRFTGRCPFHQDKSPSFTVYADQGTFHCYGCGAHGDCFDFIMRAENLDFRGAVARLGGDA